LAVTGGIFDEFMTQPQYFCGGGQKCFQGDVQAGRNIQEQKVNQMTTGCSQKPSVSWVSEMNLQVLIDSNM